MIIVDNALKAREAEGRPIRVPHEPVPGVDPDVTDAPGAAGTPETT